MCSSDLKIALRGSDRDYTRGPIGRAIFVLAIPVVLEMAMESIFAVTERGSRHIERSESRVRVDAPLTNDSTASGWNRSAAADPQRPKLIPLA